MVFTSVNGVERFWKEMRAAGRDARSLAGVHLCAIGPATAAALEMEGLRADLVPTQFVSEAVVEALAAEVDLAGARVLLPRAEVAREALPALLRRARRRRGRVAAYRTDPDAREAAHLRERWSGRDRPVTFTSSSTVRNYVEAVGTHRTRPGRLHRAHHLRHRARARAGGGDRGERVHHPGPRPRDPRGEMSFFPDYRAAAPAPHSSAAPAVARDAPARDDLVLPLFVTEGSGVRAPIASMPGVAQTSVDELVPKRRRALALGIPAVILFGIPTREGRARLERLRPGRQWRSARCAR